MPLPLLPLAIPAGTLLLLLLTQKKAVDLNAKPKLAIEPPDVVPNVPQGPIDFPPPPPPEKIPGTDRPVPGTESLFVTASGLKIHDGPHTTDRTIATALRGEPLMELEADVDAPPPPADGQGSDEFGWSRVRKLNPPNAGVEGFVASRWLSSSGAGELSERRRQKIEKQGSEAEQHVEQPIEPVFPTGPGEDRGGLGSATEPPAEEDGGLFDFSKDLGFGTTSTSGLGWSPWARPVRPRHNANQPPQTGRAMHYSHFGRNVTPEILAARARNAALRGDARAAQALYAAAADLRRRMRMHAVTSGAIGKGGGGGGGGHPGGGGGGHPGGGGMHPRPGGGGGMRPGGGGVHPGGGGRFHHGFHGGGRFRHGGVWGWPSGGWGWDGWDGSWWPWTVWGYPQVWTVPSGAGYGAVQAAYAAWQSAVQAGAAAGVVAQLRAAFERALYASAA